ncbi:MAG: 50S ribosomal protein L22 [Endomicrobiales bacterium]|jgi:large subunit ribosomal protein L22
MEAAAQSKFVRYAPRKVNQVLKLIRAKSVTKAFDVLSFTPKTTATLIAKTLKSAVANGGRLKNLDSVWVKECWVGQGPALKRMRPGPMGRGMPFKRKTCHLTIVVSDHGMPVNKKQKKVAATNPT